MKIFLENLERAFYNVDKASWDLNTELLLRELKRTKPEEFKTDEDLRKLNETLTVSIIGVLPNKEDEDGWLSFVGWSFKFPFTLVVDSEKKIKFNSSVFHAKSRFSFSATWTPNFRNTKFLDAASFMSCFRGSKLLSADFRDSIFGNGCHFYDVSFAAKTKFSNCIFSSLDEVAEIYDRTDLSRYRNDEAVFVKSTFEESADFKECTFNAVADFRKTIFTKGAIFDSSKFINLTDFRKAELGNKDAASVASFRDAEFEGRVSFEGAKFKKEVALDLSKAVFKGPSAHFTKSKPSKDGKAKEDEKYLGLKELKAHHTIFECPAIFDLKFQSCPDFSKTHFLKYVSIEETWPKEGEVIKKIGSEEEKKFRFFKNYFEKNGNHFKEREYFSYEMKAAERRKLISLVELGKKEFSIRSSKEFVRDLIGKPFEWIWKCSDLTLFKIYKWTSDYGMSVFRPAAWLIFSCGVLCFISSIPLSDSIVATILPIFGSKELRDSFGDAELFLVVQSSINAMLIFLFFLGIRNKFKIK